MCQGEVGWGCLGLAEELTEESMFDPARRYVRDATVLVRDAERVIKGLLAASVEPLAGLSANATWSPTS